MVIQKNKKNGVNNTIKSINNQAKIDDSNMESNTNKQENSTFSTAMYSPWESLNMFFFLSIIDNCPLGVHIPVIRILRKIQKNWETLRMSIKQGNEFW